MAKKRVHEIAKAQGLSSKELLAALKAAGIEAKAAASSVEEADALKALRPRRATAAPTAPKPKAAPRSPPKRRRKAAAKAAAEAKPAAALENAAAAANRRSRGAKAAPAARKNAAS